MKPRQHEEALGRCRLWPAVDNQKPERRIASRVDRRVELRLELPVELRVGGDGPAAHGRGDERGRRAGGPVKLAPGERPPEPRGRPRTGPQEPVEGAADPLGGDGRVALDDQERVVADARARPERLHRDEDEIGAAQGQPPGGRRPRSPKGPAGSHAAPARPGQVLTRGSDADRCSSPGPGGIGCCLGPSLRRESRSRIPPR